MPPKRKDNPPLGNSSLPKVQKRANSKVISSGNKGIVTINVNSDVWKGIDVDQIDEDDDHADPVPSTSTNKGRNTSNV